MSNEYFDTVEEATKRAATLEELSGQRRYFHAQRADRGKFTICQGHVRNMKTMVLDVWKKPCYLCGQSMIWTDNLHWHHISYFPVEIRRLVHASCHAKVTHAKENPFPKRFRPPPNESHRFYSNRRNSRGWIGPTSREVCYVSPERHPVVLEWIRELFQRISSGIPIDHPKEVYWLHEFWGVNENEREDRAFENAASLFGLEERQVRPSARIPSIAPDQRGRSP